MKQWHALRSKPKKESSAATLLEKVGIETYVPQLKVVTSRGTTTLEPFFPGYLFSRLDPDQGEVRLANYTSGVLYVVGYGDEPCPVSDQLIRAIQARLPNVQGPPSGFRHGDHLVIVGGPLSGLEALFDNHLSATGRVRVLIDLLQRQCQAELHVSQLRHPASLLA